MPTGLLFDQIHDQDVCATVDGLGDLYFAEICWADIAREHAKDAPRGMIRWASQLAGQISHTDRAYDATSMRPVDPQPLARTLGDISLTIQLFRFFLFAQLKIDTEHFAEFVRDLIVSVQLFAEFGRVREKILQRFRDTLSLVEDKAQQLEQQTGRSVEVHLCGHSLGAVIGLVGLLRANCRRDVSDSWLSRVRSFCTLGSPADLFTALWPKLWPSAGKTGGSPPPRRREPIRWINYVDRADPIGTTSAAVRGLVRSRAAGLFADGAPQDVEFHRSAWPGEAHVEYWKDQAIFDHWIGTSIIRQAKGKRRPSNRLAGFAPPILLGLICLALSIAAAWFLLGWWRLHFAATARTGWADWFGRPLLAVPLLGQIVIGSAIRSSRRKRWFLLGGLLLALGVPALQVLFQYVYQMPQPIAWRWTELVAGGLGGLAAIQLLLDCTRWPRALSFLVVAGAIAAASLLSPSQGALVDLRNDLLPLAITAGCWWLATLWWRFYTVWVAYVRGRDHVAYLCRRWGIAEEKE